MKINNLMYEQGKFPITRKLYVEILPVEMWRESGLKTIQTGKKSNQILGQMLELANLVYT